MSLKLTSAERLRIKAWLEKDPKSEDTASTIDMNRDDGTFIRLRRTTHYYGDSWKVRTAYEVESNFPICHSSPLPYGSNVKTKTGPKWVMTPKFDPPAESKAAQNKGAFAKAIDAEMKNLKKQYAKQLNAPSAWDSLLFGPKPTEVKEGDEAKSDAYVTYKVQKGSKGKFVPALPEEAKTAINTHIQNHADYIGKNMGVNYVQPEGDPS